MQLFDLLVADLLFGVARHCFSTAIPNTRFELTVNHSRAGDFRPAVFAVTLAIFAMALGATNVDEELLCFSGYRVIAATVAATSIVIVVATGGQQATANEHQQYEANRQPATSEHRPDPLQIPRSAPAVSSTTAARCTISTRLVLL